MNFKYRAVTENSEQREGVIEAMNKDQAIAGLQRRGLVVLSVVDEDSTKSIFKMSFFESVPVKDVVILSRQMATLFEAQVAALKIFSLLASATKNKLLQKKLNAVVSDIQSGSSISNALAKHPDIFSDFYVNMVKAGEESGKLNETFNYLADYLDRQYSLTSKVKNALIYPAFVIGVFVTVMTLMFVVIVPKLSAIILDSGQKLPFYTRVIFAMSDFLVHYGIFVLMALVVAGFYGVWLLRTEKGKDLLDRLKTSVPVFGPLFQKVYLARISDNFNTMLGSGIPMLRSIEITADVVGNRLYSDILKRAAEDVKTGTALSAALAKNPEIPSILSQMIKVGEETGSVASILKTLSNFYKREVDDAVDTMVGLIEPIMIVALGLGVGVLLTSVLMPIYNIAGGIN